MEVHYFKFGTSELAESFRRAAARMEIVRADLCGQETRCVTGHDGVTRVQTRPAHTPMRDHFDELADQIARAEERAFLFGQDA